jgi:hypothetical protein
MMTDIFVANESKIMEQKRKDPKRDMASILPRDQ